MMGQIQIEKVRPNVWEIPREGPMRVPGRVYASDEMMAEIRRDESLAQVRNVACLPGIVGASLAMPDIHWGYGFPIGGVAATEAEGGAISPGGVGYDINCGVRLARSDIEADALGPARLRSLVDALFEAVPSGVGSEGSIRKLSRADQERMLVEGARWAVEEGFGTPGDLDHTEENGRIAGADPDAVSDRAKGRGLSQVGTLGSGNHFLEIQRVSRVLDPALANAFGLFAGQVVVMIHSGSRGFGYQICDDYIKRIKPRLADYGYDLPDVQLAAAPLDSDEGRDYLGAMRCAANYAWCNRQVMLHKTREAFQRVLGIGPGELRMDLVYDVCHNIAKIETHRVDGVDRKVCVHRKGATRAFPPGHPDVPAAYRSSGQPVLVPGSMGSRSYVCAGIPGAMVETFGSTCHGAGRRLSRTAARKEARGRDLLGEMEARGVIVRATGMRTVAEEMPFAYKDVADVTRVMEEAGVSRRVVELAPMGVVKG
ncbi:MAG TPA: RtcB family protein [Gemmatimonadota bacterium]|nr:RtcB family protein [Gemmatimonadota bacterium]